MLKEKLGREALEGGDICLPVLIHVDVWQKPTEYCKHTSIKNKVEVQSCLEAGRGGEARSRDSQESSPTPRFKSVDSSVLSLLYGTSFWNF